jgi:hypothetical protein
MALFGSLLRLQHKTNRRFLGVLANAAVALCVCLWLAGGLARAQVTGQGTITGTVTDSSGAVIVGAQIDVTNTETKVTHSSVTNSTGYFEVNALNPGVYSILASAPGFENLLRAGITLEADAHAAVPLKLNPGRTAETVTVTADAQLLNTESGSSGQVLTTRQLEELPVSGSSPTWLAIIAPGVQGNVGQAASTGDGGGLLWTGLTQDFGNFGRLGINEFSLDGAPNETSGRQAGINQAPDEVGEMKFDVTGYDSSIGHTMGVSVTATTKPGTGDFHGAVRETYTPQRLEAQNHFSGLNYRYQQGLAGCVNGASTSPACYALENKYGNPGVHTNNGDAAIGGPVYIPHLIDGRNKLFFFASVIDDVLTSVGAGSATVPSMQERTGDFSDLLSVVAAAGPVYNFGDPNPAHVPAAITGQCPVGTPFYGQYQIYNPYSTTVDSGGTPRRTPVCNDNITTLKANTAFQTLYNSLLPVPTQTNLTGTNYTFTQAAPQTFRGYTTREDYKFSGNDDLFVRYTRQNYTKQQNDFTAGNIGGEKEARWITVASIGWDHVFSANTNLELTVGGTNYDNTCCYHPLMDALRPSSLGLPSYTDQYALGASAKLTSLPVISVNSYNTVGYTDNAENITRAFAVRGNLTHVMGRHTIRTGAEWRLQNNSTGVGGNVSGTYNFDNTYMQENNGSDSNPLFSVSNTGLSYAALLMGANTSQSVARNASLSTQSPYFGIYVGDTWRVTPKLTVIPGIRYEFEAGVVEKHNQLITGWNSTADLSSISQPANAAYAAALAKATSAGLAILPTSLLIQGGPQYAGVNGAPRVEWNNNYRILPRIAASYQVNQHMVIRGGYGLFYDTLNALNPQVNQNGFSTNTSANSSTNFGVNYTAPLSNPFPANASGVQFNTPIGSAAGSLNFLGSGPTIYDQNLTPAREQRGSAGLQYQFGPSTLLDVTFNIARTSNIQMGRNMSHAPSSLYTSGQQPNSVTSGLLNQQIPNPFLLANFAGVATSNPAAYNLMSLNSYYKAANITIGNLIRAYPQMTGLTIQQAIGSSNFEELLMTLSQHYHNGLTFTGTLQVNDQHDADYFANAYDPSPSWEPSNSSLPTRLTVETVWAMPFGRNHRLFNSGWENLAFGGYRISGSYEAQPGQLIGFGNLFYVGTPNASSIKIKSPQYVNGQATGGSNYVQWLSPGNATATVATTTTNGLTTTTCTFSGNGFVINPSCQPNGYNTRVFPTRINGVRQMGMNGANITVSRDFPVWERMTLETSIIAYNAFNHQILAAPNTSVTNSNFGRVTGDGWPNSSGRWLSIQGRLRF